MDDAGQHFLRSAKQVPRRRRNQAAGPSARLIVALTAAAGLAAGWLTARTGYHKLLDWPALQVKQVSVEGVVESDKSGLEQRLVVLEGHNILTLDLKQVRELARREPWVKDATVRRVFPDRVIVRVVERTPLAVNAVTGELIDSEGVPIAGTAGRVQRHPRDTAARGQARALPRVVVGNAGAPALAAALRIIKLLSASSSTLLERVAAVDVSEPGDLQLLMSDSERRLHLGADSFVPRLNRFLNVESVIAERFPSARRIDLRFEGRVIVSPVPGADS